MPLSFHRNLMLLTIMQDCGISEPSEYVVQLSRQCKTDVTSLVLDFSVWSSQKALHVLIAL